MQEIESIWKIANIPNSFYFQHKKINFVPFEISLKRKQTSDEEGSSLNDDIRGMQRENFKYTVKNLERNSLIVLCFTFVRIKCKMFRFFWKIDIGMEF